MSFVLHVLCFVAQPCLNRCLSPVQEGALTLKLFKLLFAAFSNYVDMEPVILPHLVHMMERVMQLVVTEKQSAGYLQLLRSFFKGVHSAGSKLKSVHAELLPFLQPCLTLILAMLNGPNVSELRNLLLELCLTLPAQLSHLLPLLPRLMKPLVQALQVSKQGDEAQICSLLSICYLLHTDQIDQPFQIPIYLT